MIASTPEHAKVRFHCRRGMSELEDILYPFFDNHFTTLSVEQQQAFVALLTEEDTDLWSWLVTRQQEPPVQLKAIVERIRAAT